jgi:hypothetical protein
VQWCRWQACSICISLTNASTNFVANASVNFVANASVNFVYLLRNNSWTIALYFGLIFFKLQAAFTSLRLSKGIVEQLMKGIYIVMFRIYLLIYLFIYLFVYLFTYLLFVDLNKFLFNSICDSIFVCYLYSFFDFFQLADSTAL